MRFNLSPSVCPGIVHLVAEGGWYEIHSTRSGLIAIKPRARRFGTVCDLLEEFPRVIVAGGHTTLADFQHYVAKHRPRTADRITACEVVDHPTDNQLVALARKRFEAFDRLA